MSIEDKKAAAKSNLHGMLKRMQDRKMEKSFCIVKLAKALKAKPERIEQLWDLVAKATNQKPCECAECHKKEDDQVKPGPTLKDQKMPAKREPLSGHAHEAADEGEQAPAVKKSASFWHEDEYFYTPKTANPFTHRTHGQNLAYTVDQFIDEATTAQTTALAKSNFLYVNGANLKPATSIDEMIANGTDRDGLWEDLEDVVAISKSSKMVNIVKSFSDEDLTAEVDPIDMWGDKVVKAQPNPDAEAVSAQVAANAKQNAKAEDDAKKQQREAVVDEKLTRIEERAGGQVAGKLVKNA